MDQDYVSKLSPEEKQWLSNFNEEWLGGNFQHKGKILHRKKEEKRDCYHRNNARNRDLYGISSINHLLEHVGNIMSMPPVGPERPMGETEDQIIELLDLKMEAEPNERKPLHDGYENAKELDKLNGT